MKKLIFIIFLSIIILGCPPVIDNGDDTDTDTTEIDSIPVDTTITDSTITDTTVTDTTEVDTTTTDTTDTTEVIDTTETTETDTIIEKEVKNKYDSKLNKEKKQSYNYLYWVCPSCSAKRYTDYDIKMNGDEQELVRKCLKCFAEFKIKRKKGFYEIEPK